MNQLFSFEIMDLHNAGRIMNSSMVIHNRFRGLNNSIEGDTISNFHLHNSNDRTL